MSEARLVLLDPPPSPAFESVWEPGESLLLDGPQAWRVVAGRVEVYSVLADRKRFLAEYGEGSVLFGAPSSPGTSLSAVLPEGGRLLPVDLAPSPSDLAEKLDGWIDGLSQGVGRLAPARPDAITTLGVKGADRVMLASVGATSVAHGVAWILREDGGALDFMGTAARDAIPLTASTWASTAEAGEIISRPTAWVLEHQPWADRLAAFHSAVSDALSTWNTLAEAAEQERVERREARTADDLADAQRRLDAVLSGRLGRKETGQGDVEWVLARVAPGVSIRPSSAGAMPDLAADLEARGLRAREVMLGGMWWRRDLGPLVGVRDRDRRPVALVPDWRGRYVLRAPGEPAERLDAAVAASLDPVGFQLLAPFPNRPLRPRDVFSAGLALCRVEIAALALASVASSLLGLALPVATAAVIDTFVPNRLGGGLVVLGLSLAVLTICNSLMHLVSDLTRLRVDGRLSTAIQGGVMDRLLRMPSAFTRSHASADLALRISSMESLRRLVTGTVVTTMLSSAFGLSSAALLVIYNPVAASLAVGLAAGLIAAAGLSGRAQLRALERGEAMTANVSSLTLQLIHSVSTLRSFAAERRLFVVWARNAAEQRSRVLRSRRFLLAFDALLASYDTAALAGCFAILGYAASSDRLSTGDYVAFLTTFSSFLLAAEGVARASVQIIGALPAVRRSEVLLATPPETSPAAADPGRLSGAVEVSQVKFRYGSDTPLVLNGLSLSIEPGRFVAIVGPSGSGKSTLINMITGLDKPEGGAVLFDGKDLVGLDRAAVRRQIGIVRQSGKLIAASLYENIVGLHGGTIDDAWGAAERAGVADEIRALPMGLHTVVSEGVSTFSGGQVQRLLLARALAGNPQILILDEATSALDNPTQEAVMAGIDDLGITRIVIAHRLSSIRRADQIYFLDGGRMVETGTFDSLMRAGTRFAEFATRQLL